MGIEPTALAWEARVLPLYDARVAHHFMRGCGGWASENNAGGESEVTYTPSRGDPLKSEATTTCAAPMKSTAGVRILCRWHYPADGFSRRRAVLLLFSSHAGNTVDRLTTPYAKLVSMAAMPGMACNCPRTNCS